MVTLDAKLPMDEHIKIKRADRDRLRGSRSRLAYGTILTREDVLLITLAASENRASSALARTYPGGKKAFIKAMNAKAKELGLRDTHFRDSSGLHSQNVSTAKDLVKLVKAASEYPTIREMTTVGKDYVTDLRSGWKVEFFNTNRLVRRKGWDIELSKTGYIADAGHCLVMNTVIEDRPVIIVLLNSWGKLSKFGDSNRIRRWLMRGEHRAKQVANI
jgi:D-alanyl-D-alanine endopeptidase (penicillin-binding protein 7)